MKWCNVLLTSAGLFDRDGKPFDAIINRLTDMATKPFSETKVLFIATAALDPASEEDMTDYIQYCKSCLLRLGIPEGNITTHNIDGTLTKDDALFFDMIFFTGGNTAYLANQMKKFNFDKIVKAMVYANKIYVGNSAGSMIASKNFYLPFDYQAPPEVFTGIGLTDICITVHCAPGTPSRNDLSCPHFSLTDRQAIVIRSDGYELVEA